MRRRSKPYVVTLVAAAVALLLSSWGTGTSEATPSGPSAPAQTANTRTTTVRYGPYSFQAAASTDHEDAAHTGNRFELNAEKPCSNCYITGMHPALTNAAGEEVGLSTGPMLHHMVLSNSDADRSNNMNCGFGSFGSQRFFASGDERNHTVFPPNYGYQIDTGSWTLIWEGANHSTVPHTVYFDVTYDWVPDSTPGMNDVEPVWLDLGACTGSNISVPAGQSSQDATWTANHAGDVIFASGHQHGNSMHGGGVRITIENESTGELICESVAGYGTNPLSIDPHGVEWLSEMTSCSNTQEYESFGHVNMGDQITLTGYYDQHEADSGQMGISRIYLADPPGGGGPGPGTGDDCSVWEVIFGLCDNDPGGGGTDDCSFLRRLFGLC